MVTNEQQSIAGFLPVFKTKAAARKVYGKNVPLVELTVKKGGEQNGNLL